MRIFDRTFDVLERSLDARLLRHNVLAGNLANADTPGFVPGDVDVTAAMASGGPPDAAPGTAARGDIPLAVAGTAAAAGWSPRVVSAARGDAGLDGNGVDVDRTLAAVAENAIQYGAAARAVSKKLAILRYAANDGAGA